jgi:hypothetical protein
MEILTEILYRGYWIYYFNDCCEEIIRVEMKEELNTKERLNCTYLSCSIVTLIVLRESYGKYKIQIKKALKII